MARRVEAPVVSPAFDSDRWTMHHTALCGVAKFSLLPASRSGAFGRLPHLKRSSFATATAATKPAEAYFTTRSSCKAAGIVGAQI